MTNKILFDTGLPAKNRLRINGHGLHQFEVKISRPKEYPKALITTSDFGKQNKIMLYPDVVKSGTALITIMNLTPYPVDLETGDHIGTLISFPSRCECNNENE